MSDEEETTSPEEEEEEVTSPVQETPAAAGHGCLETREAGQ